MNAIYLHLPDGTPTEWSMCSECHAVAAPGNFDVSEKCCTCYDCGKPLSKDDRKCRSLYHRDCARQRLARHNAEALEKAELATDYKGPVYCEGRRGSYGDGYFADIMELAESLDMDDDQTNRPQFAFCCEEQGIQEIDVNSLLESACEEMDEDAQDRLNGVEDLEEACAAFNKANKNVVSFTEDRKRKVAVPPVNL